MEKWDLGGASLAIAYQGRLVYAKGFGISNNQTQEPVQPYHQFRIASVSKLITAAGIMKAREIGLLDLDQVVFGPQGILCEPKYGTIRDPLAYQIRILHLLQHTGGWRNVLRRDPMFAPVAVAQVMQVDAPPSLPTTIRFMLDQRGLFEPGTFYDYSNFGYCVLGEVLQQVYGKPYEQLIQEQVLHPLGLHRMRLGQSLPSQKAPWEVSYYTHPQERLNVSFRGTSDSVSRAYEGTYLEGLGAAGAWIASPSEILKLGLALVPGEKPETILQDSSLIEMQAPNPQDSIGPLFLGWKRVDEEGCWRSGSLASGNALLLVNPEGLSWCFLSNTGTWRGPYFIYEVAGLLRRTLPKVNNWPDRDLFEIYP